MNIPRVVIDTNLVISALVFAHGRLTPLRYAWQNKQIQALICKSTAAEIIRVLKYPKFRLSPDEQQELLADYLPFCETVVLSEPPPDVPACRDSMDLAFLHLAVDGKADFLLTGDQDLLSLNGQLICPILKAEIFFTNLDDKFQ